MFCAFFLALLVSGWLSWNWLAGATFAAGSAAAARYTHRRDLLTVVVSPPMLFFCALVLARALTASGHLLTAVAGGMLTLATVAPWLFAGEVLALAISLARGLLNCVRELRRDLHATPPGVAAARPADPLAQSRRATPQ
jgi:Domain of unknown function (DUF6542)